MCIRDRNDGSSAKQCLQFLCGRQTCDTALAHAVVATALAAVLVGQSLEDAACRERRASRTEHFDHAEAVSAEEHADEDAISQLLLSHVTRTAQRFGGQTFERGHNDWLTLDGCRLCDQVAHMAVGRCGDEPFDAAIAFPDDAREAVSYTHLRAHETRHDLV